MRRVRHTVCAISSSKAHNLTSGEVDDDDCPFFSAMLGGAGGGEGLRWEWFEVGRV